MLCLRRFVVPEWRIWRINQNSEISSSGPSTNSEPLREALSTSADANGGLPMVEITKTQTIPIQMMTTMMILAILMTPVIMLLILQARIPLPNGSV